MKAKIGDCPFLLVFSPVGWLWVLPSDPDSVNHFWNSSAASTFRDCCIFFGPSLGWKYWVQFTRHLDWAFGLAPSSSSPNLCGILCKLLQIFLDLQWSYSLINQLSVENISQEGIWSSCCGTIGLAASLQSQDTGSIPHPSQWVEGSSVTMAPIWTLAREFYMSQGRFFFFFF